MSNNGLSPMGHSNILLRYWQAYGGSSALVRSPCLYMALFLTYILKSAWLNDSSVEIVLMPWWDAPISVLPSLLGFSLGGYLMWLGVGDSSFKAWLHRRSDPLESSVFLEVSATFVHFVVVQLLALVFAVVAKYSQFSLDPDSLVALAFRSLGLSLSEIFGRLAPVGYGCGFFLFLYALFTALEAVLGVFRVSSWQDFHARKVVKKGRWRIL